MTRMKACMRNRVIGNARPVLPWLSSIVFALTLSGGAVDLACCGFCLLPAGSFYGVFLLVVCVCAVQMRERASVGV